MTETTIPQTRVEGSGRAAQRIRAGRVSKVAYRNKPAYSAQNARETPTYPSSPEQMTQQPYNQFYLQLSTSGQSITQTYNNLQHQGGEDPNPRPIGYQQGPIDGTWISTSPYPYTLAASNESPISPLSFGGSLDQSLNHGFSQVSNSGQDVSSQDPSWVFPANVDTDLDDISGSDPNSGSFGSFDGFGISSSTDTLASSNSGDYVLPPVGSGFESPATAMQLNDLKLTEDFYQAGVPKQSYNSYSPCAANANPTSPMFLDQFDFDVGYDFISPMEMDCSGYTEVGEQPSSATIVVPSQNNEFQTETPTPPWNSEIAQHSAFQVNANAGGVTFEPLRGAPYNTFNARQFFLDTGQTFPVRDAISPDIESPSEKSWVMTPYPNSEAPSGASHGSPLSHNSPLSNPPSPPRHGSEVHDHIFSSMIRKSKPPRGRQRGLTPLEKRQARDVREAKACWACHISKTKCSPCSPGVPCEQCARLAGKRRFCLFDCFNDPLETLNVFLVPEYLMGHFTRNNVEEFVNRNTAAWGTRGFVIRMNWGYHKLLEAEVVQLQLRSDSTEMRYQHQTDSDENGNTILVRKESPPVGIPLAAMDDMVEDYARYVHEIAQGDLASYVATAYWDDNSVLPRRLLSAVCSFYSAGRECGSEVDLLRRAIEMHITMTILQRSLVLDEESLNRVHSHIHSRIPYPEDSAPRCVQRQIKLAFFLFQQRRIMKVLKDWGSMMWATNNNPNKDQEWAVAFGVFVILILVMDKTLSAAHLFCEGRIRNYGHEADSERQKLDELVRLTERELFDRCKEIFHWKFKTRKGGKEACNPIRDGLDAFHKSRSLDGTVERLVYDLRDVVGDFEHDVHSARKPHEKGSAYADAGRLACVFLGDFVVR